MLKDFNERDKALLKRVFASRGNTGTGIAEEYPETLQDILDAARAEGVETARLSDRGEGLGERPEPARERRGDPSPAQPADDWIEWKGGENPALEEAVQVRYRGGAIYEEPSAAFSWLHLDSAYDIIAYRIIPATPSDTGKASG